MNSDFNYKSNIKDVQNRLISQSIKDTSNLELLKSEEAIQAVIKSYIDRFQSVGGMLFDVSQYLAKSKTVIRSETFNEMFNDLYIDLVSLYADLDIVEQVLSLNLQRNKNFFSIIKKRIRDLWNKLSLSRLYIYDSNPADESYYESFYTDIYANRTQNVLVDKKLGFLYLKPRQKVTHNISQKIKKISSVTYPVNSDNGGALHTTSQLNTFEDNYTNGPRDMLQHGLWKEEVICDEIPNIIYNIGSSGVPLYRNYRGIVSIIDIEYAYPVDINKLDFDLFGDRSTTIDAVLYKSNDNDDWSIANFALDDPLSTIDPTVITKRNSVRGSAFDVISFGNIQKFTCKVLRLVINQDNYNYIDTKDTGEKELDKKIEKDLSERRYELVKFGANYEDALSTPINDENVSLYNKIVNIIESVSNVESILEEIEKVLLPPVNIVTYDFTRAIKFEVGTWSIEPSLETYERQFGIFDSKPYPLRDRSLVSVSLKTKQKIPEATTCSWYISVDNKNIPIIENNSYIRKEKMNAISMRDYSNFKDWSPGSFILLDFPINPYSDSDIGIYTDGNYNPVAREKIAFLNSRLLFIKDMVDPYRSEFVIRYSAALYNSVNLYSLSIKSTSSLDGELIPLGIVSSRREVLDSFIESVRFRISLEEEVYNKLLSEQYSVVNAYATKEEAEGWFGSAFSSCLFISSSVMPHLNIEDLNPYQNVYRQGDSKLLTSSTEMLNFFNGVSSGASDLNLLSSIANLCPFNVVRLI
jgi:hypothetical protein